MNAFNRFAAILGIALVTAQAQAVDFSLVSNTGLAQAFGNTYTATVDGLTLSASAWSSARQGGTFEAAALNLGTVGMGVCSSREKANCTAKNSADALGNKSYNELILFSFSSTVELDTLKLLQLGKDSDLSLWAGVGAITLDGMKASELGIATLIDNKNKNSGDRSINLGSVLGGSYDWIAVAARIGQKDDFAKLQSLTINPVAQPVPEASKWMTMLAGLGLVGFIVGRRRT